LLPRQMARALPASLLRAHFQVDGWTPSNLQNPGGH
jgi:hypothetical protein